MAEDEERRLVITGSACLDKLVVDTDRLSVSRGKQQTQLKHMNSMTKKEKESWGGAVPRTLFKGLH